MNALRRLPFPLLVAALAVAAHGQGRPDLVESRKQHLPDLDARAAFLVDVDRDGDLDALCHGTRVELLVQVAPGRFVEATAAALPADIGAVLATGDFDADGDVDLVARDRLGLRLFRNSGTGVFTGAVTSPARPLAMAAAAADIDGDRDLDLVVTYFREGTVRFTVHANDGTGGFTLVHTEPGFANWPIPYFVDLDGDRDQDLVMADSFTTLWENVGGQFANNFSLPPISTSSSVMAAADVEGDGDQDLLLGGLSPAPGGQSRVLLINNGRGVFTDQSTRLGANPSTATLSILASDFDRDGDVDFVLGHREYQSESLRNDGTGVFTRVGTGDLSSLAAPSFVAGDLDGDRTPDLFTLPRHIFLGRTDGRFAQLDPAAIAPQGALQLFADFDGDGDADLLRLFDQGIEATRTIERNDGTGQWTVLDVLQPLPNTLQVAAAGDIDGDLDLDLVYALGLTTRRLATLRNNGSGRFGAPVLGTVTLPGGVVALHLADIDGDRDLDVLDIGNVDLRIATNDGAGNFGNDLVLTVGPTYQSEVTDVDGDGDQDILLAGDQLTLLENRNGTFVDSTAQTFPARPGGFGTPRLLRNATGTWLFWCRLDGIDGYEKVGTAFVRRPFLTVGVAGRLTSAVVVPGGLDRDPVLVVALELGSERQLVAYAFYPYTTWRDVTAAVFGASHAFRAMLPAGDFDGDGDVDAVVQAPDLSFRLLRGTARMIHAPFAAQLGRSFELRVADAAGNVLRPPPAVVLLGRQIRVPLAGVGVLRVDPTTAALLPVAFTTPNEVTLQLPVPNNIALRDVAFAAQALHVDAAGLLRLGAAVREVIR